VSISVLLADDQPLLRRGFRMILEAEGDLVIAAEAGNGEEAVILAQRHAPDVVLMDIRMPGTDGIEATRRITAADGRVRVLVLTTFDLDEYAFGALRAGASGFLLKDVRPGELVTAIRTVASGDAVISPRVTRRLLEEYAQVLPLSASQQAERYPQLEALTEREREVLIAVARGLSNTEIAVSLYVSEATVKSHVGRILAKLSLRDRVQVVVLAYEAGLIQPGLRLDPLGGRPGDVRPAESRRKGRRRMTDAPAVLRKLLAGPSLVRAPGVFDGLGAHLVRRAGFPAVYLTGAGVSVSGYGLPDVGLVTGTEMAGRVALAVQASELPVIADADTGYGGPINVVRTVRAYEQAGAAAIQLEDQVFPKRCGHLAGKEVVSSDEFVRKLSAALDARQAGTVLIARTDARGPAGLDEAIARANRYAAEGADLIFVEAPESAEEVRRIAAEVSAPLMFNVVPSGRSPEIADDELERLGFALAIYPLALLEPAAVAMAAALARMGGRHPGEIAGPAKLFDLVGLGEWTGLGDRYTGGAGD
jgi:2-methylisocitrate lyase-like PEP mutase family enzyme/DNA-binding NarL/FixJ family response regulator